MRAIFMSSPAKTKTGVDMVKTGVLVLHGGLKQGSAKQGFSSSGRFDSAHKKKKGHTCWSTSIIDLAPFALFVGLIGE